MNAKIGVYKGRACLLDGANLPLAYTDTLSDSMEDSTSTEDILEVIESNSTIVLAIIAE